MLTSSSVVLVFLLGASCGALLLSIGRAARMQRLRTAFHSDLQSICDQLRYDTDMSGPELRITEDPEAAAIPLTNVAPVATST